MELGAWNNGGWNSVDEISCATRDLLAEFSERLSFAHGVHSEAGIANESRISDAEQSKE